MGVTAGLIAFALSAAAQYSETLRSDRPGQSNSPYTAGKKILQIQSGLQFEGANLSNDFGDYKFSNFAFPAYFRYGVTEKFEVNLGIGYRKVRLKEDGETASKSSGIDLATVALRFNVFEETEKIPALGFEFTYKTKVLSEDFKPDYPSGKFNLMASKGFGEKFSITSNLGADFGGFVGPPDGFYTLSLGLAVDEHLGVFFENYGSFSGDYFDSYFDFGGAYLLSNDLQLDLFGGFGYNDDAFTWFVSGGVSYRITSWRQ